MFVERIQQCREHLDMYEHYIQEYQADAVDHPHPPDHPDHPAFGEYILLSWGARRMKEDIAWCEWVLELLQKRG